MKRLSFFIAVTLACTLLAGPGQQALLTVKTPAAGGAWYYTTPVASIDSADSNLNANTMLWYDISIGSAGNITKIGAYITTVNAPGYTIRLGLWNSGGTELIDVLTATISSTGWADVTISPVANTATTYKIGYIGQGNDDVDIGFNTAGGTNAGNYNSSQSGGNFPASLPTADGQFNGKAVLRVYVE